MPLRDITVAHNGIGEPRQVGSDEVHRLKTSLGIPNSATVLLTLGHLRAEKGYDLVLRSLPYITSWQAGEIHYVVVGSGPEEGSLRALADAQTKTPVHFCGHQADIWPWLRMADIVVIPSYRESFGLVAVEAMAVQKPVVAARIQGLTEVIQDRNSGVLFEPGDSRSLAATIGSLIDDERTRNRIAREARSRYLTTFTTQAMVRRWISVYRQLS